MASALLRSKSDSTSFLEPTKHNSRLITCLRDQKTTSYGEGTYLTRSPVCRTPQLAVDEPELTDEPHPSDGKCCRL
ncbi:hypothetical protein Hanom_Chr00s000001g01593701 [Helianthus anomalus]